MQSTWVRSLGQEDPLEKEMRVNLSLGFFWTQVLMLFNPAIKFKDA